MLPVPRCSRLTALLLLAGTACDGDKDATITVSNSDPSATITSHVDGDRVLDSVEVELKGVVGDAEDDYDSLLVTWTLDGAVLCPETPAQPDGTTSCPFTPTTDDGAEVGLQVRDSRSAVTATKVTLEVLATSPPTITITSPTDGPRHYADVPVTIAGEVSDPESDPDELTVTWESDRQGALSVDPPSTSGVIETDLFLTEGSHIITARAVDPNGNSDVDEVFVQVYPPNTAPSCSFESPAADSVVEEGEVVLLEGIVDDIDIGPEALDVAYTSSLDGELGTATPDSAGLVTFGTDDLSPGVHTITLTVSDDVDATCTATRSFRVAQPPTVRITSPAPSSEFNDGDSITFQATASDLEDSPSDLSVRWESSLDGDFGTAAPDSSGNIAVSAVLSVGDHEVRLFVTDTDDFTTSTLTLVTVKPCEYFYDGDGDGYGDPTTGLATCTPPVNYVEDNTDCDDSDPTHFPGADEYCDGADDDCDGTIDENDALDASLWYTDADSDGYGDPATVVTACTQPSGTIATGRDCDDADTAVNPAAEEVCGDGIDDDCDGADLPCIINVPLATTDVILVGESAQDEAGTEVRAVGDVDGDGYDDVLVGAPTDDIDAVNSGTAYLVLGNITGTLDLSGADARLIGVGSGTEAGFTVGAAGDVDGDGYDDILVGSPYVNSTGTDAGAAYLLLGPVTGDTDLATADYVFQGDAADDQAGVLARGIGDWDGDGLDDLIVGALEEDTGASNAGMTYLITASSLSSGTLSSVAWARFSGERSDDQAGRNGVGAGDLDGDGQADLLISSPPEDTGGNASGSVYMVLGPSTGGLVDLRYADAQLYGEGDNHFAGRSVASPGDVTGDGYNDIVVGADGEDSLSSGNGAVYVWHGPIPTGTRELSGADTKLVGSVGLDYLGRSVSTAGDVNGDGTTDLVFGGTGDDWGATDAGGAFVALGPVSTGTIDKLDLYARLYAEGTDDKAGYSVDGGFDWNGDGFDDILTGAPGEDLGGTDSGAAFITFGATTW